ncbi:MAG: NAD-dependent epimerase/dehydratase family protein [Verrucomicrobiota bacterium]
MPRILIAGCGYVGSATADLFHARGWEVMGWTGSEKSAANFAAKPYPVRAVDISDPAVTVAAARDDYDVVLQCASSAGGAAAAYRRIYLDGARNLLAAFPAVTLVFTSSTSVYAQKSGETVDENSAAIPNHEKGQILRETEELVLGRDGIVARLAGIYGPRRSSMLTKFLSGEAVLDPDDAHIINQVHRDDIATALLLLCEHRAETKRQIFNIVDDQPMLRNDAYAWLSEHLARPIPPPGKMVTPRQRGESNKRVSNRRLRELGWEPRFSNLRAAMTKSILPSFGFGG